MRDYLVQGYALNEKRLRESARQLADLKRLVQLQAEIATNQELTADQSNALLRILGDYARALDVLDQYDHQRLRVARETVATSEEEPFELTPENARQAIDALRTQFGGSELFGREKVQSFESSVRTIYQSFGGQDMYPSVEEKAANLLYSVVKTIHFRMATNALRPSFSFIFSTSTAASTALTAPGGWPIMRSSPLRCSSPKASPRTKTQWPHWS